jgi:hypothetical protein
MQLPLSRTRQSLTHELKGFIFDRMNFKKMIDLRERHELEDCMGFRGQWDEHRRFQFDFLKSHGLKLEHTFLELGCGPLTGGLPVIEYLNPAGYVGIDIRPAALNLCWQEVGRAGLSDKNPRLICSSRFGEGLLGSENFDYVYSFSVLFHLSDEILDQYFSTVAMRLKPGGVCLANVNDHMPNDRWLEFPFLNRRVDDYASIAASHGLDTKNRGTLAELGFRESRMESKNPLLEFRAR